MIEWLWSLTVLEVLALSVAFVVVELGLLEGARRGLRYVIEEKRKMYMSRLDYELLYDKEGWMAGLSDDVHRVTRG